MPEAAGFYAGVPIGARDIQDNVVRPYRRRSEMATAAAAEIYFDSPSSIVLQTASGGFNTVVEFSAPTCLRWIDHFGAPQDHFVALTGADLLALAKAKGEFTRPDISDLAAASASTPYHLGIRWSPRGLTFQDTKKVCIRYAGVFMLFGEEVRRKPPHSPSIDLRMNRFAPEPREAPGMAEREVASAVVALSPSLGELLAAAAWGRETEGLVAKSHLGTIEAEICCTYRILVEQPRVRARVTADLGAGQVEVQSMDADAKKLFDQYIAEPGGTAGVSMFEFRQMDAPLAPWLCLVGYDAALKVDTLPDFDAFAFHVEDGARQALAVGFDCAPGCRGIIENVRYFIGNSDYGVITDELVVESLFLHKWSRGGFLRTMTFNNPVTVKRSDGGEETASLVGTMHLNSLDAARIDLDANSGVDNVLISGGATLTPSYLVLRDGRRIGPQEVDLGGPSDTPWSVFTDVRLNPTYSSDPQMKMFQIRAHLDAYRFVCKPFGYLPSDMIVEPVYTRTDGVSRRIFYIANLSTPFG